jgi:hypothetical protein
VLAFVELEANGLVAKNTGITWTDRRPLRGQQRPYLADAHVLTKSYSIGKSDDELGRMLEVLRFWFTKDLVSSPASVGRIYR